MNNSFFKDNRESARITWAWAVPLLLVVFFFMGQVAAIVPAIESGWISKDEIETYPNILYMLFVVFGAVMLPLLLWVHFFERRQIASIGILARQGAGALFAKGFSIGLLMASVSVVGVWLAGGYGLEHSQDFTAVSYGPILLLMLGFIVQSSVEEILFRGWMLSRLSERYGIWIGVIGNSVLFTLMHVELGEVFDPFAFANFTAMTMLFSIFLSLMVIRQKSVLGACAWHAAWNWAYITWFGLPTTGIALDIKPFWVDLRIADGAPEWLSGGIQGPEASLLTTVVLLVGCLLLARGLKKVSK
ncbi:MAG: CPBP family intramembrane metalloprotease [Alphaproteobacteria bacterium]|nr:CPBP family intramembrane metalloprotease [Alphaproteobacteria bacterium]